MNDPNLENSTIHQLKNLLDQFDQEQPLISQMRNLIGDLELELNLLAEETQTAKQDKAKFISVVTHELRLPLTSIKGYTDLLRQGLVGPVNDQQANFLNVVRTNADRMATLISDLADTSHIQSGRLKLQPKLINLTNLIDDILLVWKPRFQEKNQEFSVHNEDSNKNVQIDPDRFKQILGYLLGNANRYTPENGQIILSIQIQEKSLLVNLQDTGIGINQDDQEKLFTAFFRSEEEEVRQSPGWGLSLHVTKLLVELMGGTIGVTSQPGSGSTFWFDIPITT